MTKSLRIATRGSALALAQAEAVRAALLTLDPGSSIELTVLKTAGDRHLDLPLAELGGEGARLNKGLFTKEIEEALLDGSADLAVHSLKDLPVQGPDGLVIAAIPEREHPADCLISKHPGGWQGLPPGAVVATDSPRRAAQLRALRPDVAIESIRGNVPTRLRKLMENERLDATILARAGLVRLGLMNPSAGSSQILRIGGDGTELAMEEFDLAEMLPAPGQGAIALQCRADDTSVCDRIAALNHPPTAAATRLERLLLSVLGGGCHLALGAYASLPEEGGVALGAFLFEGGRASRESVVAADASVSAEKIAEDLAVRLRKGGRDV